MLDQMQAPLVVQEEPYSQVRLMQMRAKQESPYDLSFLYFIQERLAEMLYARLRRKPLMCLLVDNLIMLYILIPRIEHKQLTGLDAETLTEVVGKITKLIDWEV